MDTGTAMWIWSSGKTRQILTEQVIMHENVPVVCLLLVICVVVASLIGYEIHNPCVAYGAEYEYFFQPQPIYINNIPYPQVGYMVKTRDCVKRKLDK